MKMKTGVLNCKHPNFCQDDPLSSQISAPAFVDMGHLDRENDISGRQVLNKSPKHPNPLIQSIQSKQNMHYIYVLNIKNSNDKTKPIIIIPVKNLTFK